MIDPALTDPAEIGAARPDLGEPAPDTWLARGPAPPLRPFIDQYVGYRMTGHPAGLHRGLPSRHMTLIVSIGPRIDVVAQTSTQQRPQVYRCVLGGLQASSALIAHDGNQEGVAIKLTPLGCRALFGMPARVLWDLSLELDDVSGVVGAQLWERLQPALSWRERFAVCDDVLLHLARDETTAVDLTHCWQALVRSGGRLSVGDLAERTGWSRQHLRRRFHDEFGLSPKLAARVVRFERAQHLLQSAPPFVSIAQIAAVCGYYDQAHLHRDVMALAGCTPTELAAETDRPRGLDDVDGPDGLTGRR